MNTYRPSKASLRNGSFLVLTLALAPLAFSQTPAAAPADGAVHQRVDTLLQEMTLDEKLGQLNQLFDLAPSKAIDEAVSTGQLGSLLFVTDPA